MTAHLTAHRKLAAMGAAVAIIGAAPLLLTALTAAPAQAHGALTNPMSRIAVCGLGGQQNTPACKAAIAAGGAEAFQDWDNLRVAGVAGRDRQVIPDGKLCSGGIDEYKGLDLARADWPATRLSAGAAFTFSYQETIPHKGTFKLYVTKDGYDPAQPLRWSNLVSTPFLTAIDPAIQGDAYTMKGRLPAGKSGRHMIYTIWQNSSTSDTYYSCSDVIFGSSTGSSGSTGASKSPTRAAATSPAAVKSTPTAQGTSSFGSADAPQAVQSQGAVSLTSGTPSGGGSTVPVVVISAAALVIAGIVGTAIFLRRRRSEETR
jgi:predicted carbohydrate-binding protein with CBM5 and CBM33 domain